MYFLYFFILYYTSTLLATVNTYAVLTANINDFRSLAKKYAPNKNLVDQIKVMVLESGNKNRENFNVGDLDRTVEVVEEGLDSSDEAQKPVYKQLKTPPKVSLLDTQDPSPHTVITVDDLVNELKHRILEEIIDKSGDLDTQAYTQGNDAPKTVVYKAVQNKQKTTKPIKIFQEEIQFDGTLEDSIEEEDTDPQIHYLGQIQIPAQYLKRKPKKDETVTKKLIPKKNRFVSPKHFGTGKKVRYVEQVVVPSKAKKRLTNYVLQPKLLQLVMPQPNLEHTASLGQKKNLAQQQNVVIPSILEPQKTLSQQSEELKLPLDQQPSIVQHIALMKQQIDRLNKIVEQNLGKIEPTTTSEAPLENIDAAETSFEIVANQHSNEEAEKTLDSAEYQVQEAEDILTEETTAEPIAETSTKALSIPTTVENEQFIEKSEEVEDLAENAEKHTVGSVENDTHETTTENVIETHANDFEEKTLDDATTPAEAILVKSDIIPKLDETPKIHTQEFGNPASGEPIVEKTYNFNAPVAETMAPVTLDLPTGSARKVLLF